jgi:hypothetical protein
MKMKVLLVLFFAALISSKSNLSQADKEAIEADKIQEQKDTYNIKKGEPAYDVMDKVSKKDEPHYDKFDEIDALNDMKDEPHFDRFEEEDKANGELDEPAFDEMMEGFDLNKIKKYN